MPRRARPTNRVKHADRKFGSMTVQEFTNKLMQDGKKAKAEGIVYDAIARAETSTRKPGLEVFETALKNATPLIEVKPRRVGGATYQVPRRDPRRPARVPRHALADRGRAQAPGQVDGEKLAGELMDAMNNAGAAVRRKDEVHKMAEANKAFSHYKW